ncbi:DNA phosphorothioation system sulfurtransferase DndC [Aquitalea sp. ASV15]|uniref:DNA phosphorothioation system sulfurtransferase DndC n=1 Tax=Aquitalea sp. ASV15 TaxID=2795104 RepID=UPI0018EBFFA8|nr:DNA phosphorothioation system sulfurtransferase DndC [Aquitalea sp. ASV15]
MELLSNSEKTRQLIREQYEADDRPWVVAYSGGKDSTLVLQLVMELLLELGPKARKPVYVLSSDTRVEAPNVSEYVVEAMSRIENSARARNLNLHTQLVFPDIDEGFWAKMIGKGYPPPSRWFRWCTSNMKIKPSRRAIEGIVAAKGSVILLLGSRTDESANRAQSIQSFANNERRLNPHHEIPDAMVFKPIVEWTTDEVWEYLASNSPAWGGSHDKIIQLYRQANGGECPIVLDLDTPSCGGSRFGCWTCTVVKQDKSMEGFIATGEEWMRPLNSFRKVLIEYRDKAGMRSSVKRDGTQGQGPFTPEARKKILRELLQTEREVGWTLIHDDELAHVQKIWNVEFDYTNSEAISIAREFGRSISMPNFNADDEREDFLEKAALEADVPYELLQAILGLTKNKWPSLEVHGAKTGLERDIEKALLLAAKQVEQAAP